MEEAHKLWLKEKQHLLDELYTAMLDLSNYNGILQSRRMQEIIETMNKTRKFIKEGEI